MPKADKTERQHKATFARDKLKGGWLIRVIGPRASEFAGRSVPVVHMDNSETTELLDTMVWSGIDEGNDKFTGTGKPAALYTFVAHPREKVEAEF